MSFDTHVFFQAKCDYPGCNERFESIYDWFFDQCDAAEEVSDNYEWICLYTTSGEPRFFCPDHVHSEDNQPIYFDPDNPEYQPSDENLAAFYTDMADQPLPRYECEKTILAIMREESLKESEDAA